MLILKKKINVTFIALITTFIVCLFTLLSLTPGLKGDLEQSIRILLKQPVLLKSKPISENKIINYSKKVFYGVQNRLTSNNNFEKIRIDINFTELEKLKSDRKKALKLGALKNPQKVKINLQYKGKKYKASARLKGDLPEHWGNIKQWSLRIRLKENKHIFSMNEFSISVFNERDFPYNFVISDTLKDYGILAPEYEITNVFFNGDDWGLMLIEEQFSDSFYAKNRIKEAPIFKMTNENDFKAILIAKNKTKNINDIIKWQGKLETKIYNEDKILKKTNIPDKKTNETLVSIFKNIQEAIVLNDKEHLPSIKKFINVESFAKATAITAIFGDEHSARANNSRYYLSPYNLKIEPILTDSVHTKVDENFFSKYNSLYKNIFQYENFQKIYLKTLGDLKNNFFKIEDKFIDTCKNFGKNCSNLVELDVLKQNINLLIAENTKIFQNLETSKKDHKGKFNTKNKGNLNEKKVNLRAFNNGQIFLDNLTSEILKIKSVHLKDDGQCKKKCQKAKKIINIEAIIRPSTYSNLNSKEIKINIDNKRYKFLEVRYTDEKGDIYSTTELIEKSYLEKKNFFKSFKTEINENILKDGYNYIFKAGEHIINKPIIVPAGYNLVVNKGTTLKMTEKSFIMVEDGSIKFQGSIEEPIVIKPLKEKSKWKGIYVNSNSNESAISIVDYVNISGVSYFDNGIIQLTGGLNFINSNVDISNIKIENSFSEDAINIVNSQFKISFSEFNHSISDGLDIDYGRGEIINTNFYNIKGDAIDFSGSEVDLKNIIADNVFDKAISAGEKTKLKIDDLRISSSGIGIASKDSSEVYASNIKITNCRISDFAVFQKKKYFAGGFLKADKVSSCNLSILQKGSNLSVNGKKIDGKIINIKKLYDGIL